VRLLKPEEVGKDHLGCSRATVDRLIASGRLRAVKLHQGPRKATYRVRVEDLEAFIAENLTVPENSRDRAMIRHDPKSAQSYTQGLPIEKPDGVTN
jgi:excisionase family DNA binding protein